MRILFITCTTDPMTGNCSATLKQKCKPHIKTGKKPLSHCISHEVV